MSINFSEDAQQEVVTSSRVLPEDSGEGSLRPRLLRDYTGQEKAKENLQVCIKERVTKGKALYTRPVLCTAPFFICLVITEFP